MTRNLDALRQKHKEIVDKQENTGQDFLEKYVQLKDGKNSIRILPGKTDEDMFFSETALHRITGKDKNTKNYHCLKMHGKECPLCELYFALWKEERGGGTEADKKLARLVKGRSRYYLNVVDRSSDNKVKILSVGMLLFQQISEEIISFAEVMDENGDPQEPIDILSLDDGADFIVDKGKKGDWPDYSKSKFRRKQTKVGITDPLDQLHNLEELVRVEDYNDVRTAALNIAPHMSHLFSGVDPSNMEETAEVDNDQFADQLEA